MNCLTNAAFGTGSNTILDYTLLATPRVNPNLDMKKSNGSNESLKKLIGCLKMTLESIRLRLDELKRTFV